MEQGSLIRTGVVVKKEIFAGIVFVTVLLVLGYGIFRSRQQPEAEVPSKNPEQIISNTPISADFGVRTFYKTTASLV